MNTNIRYLILTTWLMLSSLIASAQQIADQLVKQMERPTVQQIETVLNNDISKNPYPLVDYTALNGSLLTSYQNDLPRVIAQFEKAYPGAIFLGLGRDSALMVDALDAFYRAKGQPNRAKLVAASGNSFYGIHSDETLFRFLENYGVNLDNLDSSRPIIIFDGTRFNETSQSRRLLRAIYQVAATRGIQLSKLVRKINVVSTCFNGYQYYPRNLISNTNVEAYFKSQEKQITALGPTEILSVDGWYMTHGYNWTNTYGVFHEKNGKVDSTLGQATGIQERQQVLAHQVHVMQIGQSAKLAAAVDLEAKKIGYNFDENLKIYDGKAVPAASPAKKEKVILVNTDNQFKKSLIENLSHLKPYDVDYGYEKFKFDQDSVRLTNNGRFVLDELIKPANISSAHYFEISLELLSSLYIDKKIGSRDFRRILIYILSRKEIKGTAFVNMVQKASMDLLPIEIMLGREQEREKYLELTGVAEQNYRKLTKNGKLPLSCRFAYSL